MEPRSWKIGGTDLPAVSAGIGVCGTGIGPLEEDTDRSRFRRRVFRVLGGDLGVVGD